MNTGIRMLAVVTSVASVAFHAAAQTADSDADKSRKEKLQEILTRLKVDAAGPKSQKYEVSVPDPSAGARGAELPAGKLFAVQWPGSRVSPLTALATTLRSAAARGQDWASLHRQYLAFKESYPEYEGDVFFRDLGALLAPKTSSPAPQRP